MRISVVVATFDRCAQLRRLLESLFRQDLAPGDMEIIVVVDGSTDGTQAMLSDLRATCSLRVVLQANAGQAAARNAGWQLAAAPLVLFLDDDLECPPDLLTRHLAAHGSGDDRVVAGRIATGVDGRASVVHDWLNGQLLAWEQRMSGPAEPRWPVDAYVSTNCSVPRRLLADVGGFDPAFYRALEDHDLGLRLWAQGARFVYAADAVVRQRYSKSTVEAVQDEAWYGRAEVLLGRKHPEVLPFTPLAGISAMAGPKRGLLRFFARSSPAAGLCLGTPVRIIERLGTPGFARAAGRRLLAAWMQATRLRAAVAATGGWIAYDARFSRRLSVLMYHHVGPSREGTYPDLTVSAAAFEAQIAALAQRGYTGISPTQYLDWRLGRALLPERAVIVTFDDGYADIADHALPVLERHGFRSCVFVVTGRLGGTNTWDEARGSATHHLLTCEQVRHWQQRGVEFGGHSRTHASLPEVGPRALQDEVSGCRADMEKLTGLPPIAFAYPYGDCDSQAVAAVRGAFSLAFTTEEGLNALGTDAHLLCRTMVMPRDSGRTVVLRATFGFSPWDVPRRWRAAVLRPVRRILGQRRAARPDAA